MPPTQGSLKDSINELSNILPTSLTVSANIIVCYVPEMQAGIS